ncbi:MAG TPA: alpha/beta hydrolase [Gemmataceae bacterium]|nr:alpha/beta hydrolase [Gemmataceae bacterium]
MVASWRAWLHRWKPDGYARRQPLVLINGLAEQAESWFRNVRFWRRHFDVHMPNVLAYEGAALHRRIDEGLPITVEYLVDQLHLYLDHFVQAPPYHLVASSLGGKVAVEFAARHPELVSRMVLLCPSGLGDHERLPVVEGVRRNDARSVVESVFYDLGQVDPNLVAYYRRQFVNRRWRTGLLRTVRGTTGHRVVDRLAEVTRPTLLVAGREDRIVDPEQAAMASKFLPSGQFVCIPNCGHAPMIERPRLVNRLVVRFLTSPRPAPRLPELVGGGGR